MSFQKVNEFQHYIKKALKSGEQNFPVASKLSSATFVCIYAIDRQAFF